jgi:hypothetical protein
VRKLRQQLRHCDDKCFWHSDDQRLPEHRTIVSYYVELKPDMGDDYPSVLRQVERFDNDSRGYPPQRRVVLVDRFKSTSVDVASVRKIFRTRGVYLITMDELVNSNGATDCTCDECRNSQEGGCK